MKKRQNYLLFIVLIILILILVIFIFRSRITGEVVCGDGKCEDGESSFNCVTDCPVCGDGKCGILENDLSCPSDCLGAEETTGGTINIYANNIQRNVNPFSLGVAIQFKQNGEGIWNSNTQQFNSAALSYFKSMNVKSIRFMMNAIGLWNNTIGARSSRPSERDIFGTLYKNDFGVDELMELARQTGANVVIDPAWNNATAKEIAALVAYLNGNIGSTISIGIDERRHDWKTVGYWAQKRKDNCKLLFNKDCTQPYNVKYLEIGSESYTCGMGACIKKIFNTQDCGKCYNGKCNKVPDKNYIVCSLTANAYANIFNSFKSEIGRVDSNIKLGATMLTINVAPWDSGLGVIDRELSTGDRWNEKVMEIAGNSIGFLNPHYYSDLININSINSVSTEGLLANIVSVKQHVDYLVNLIGTRNIEIVATEYTAEYLEYNPPRYLPDMVSLKAALFNAAMISLFTKYGIGANYWTSIKPFPDGGGNFAAIVGNENSDCTNCNPTSFRLRPNYYALKTIFSNIGNLVVKTIAYHKLRNIYTCCGSITTPYLEVLSTRKDNKLYLLVINKYGDGGYDLTYKINLNDFIPLSTAKVYRLTSRSEEDTNENSEIVNTTEELMGWASKSFFYTFKAHSLTIMEFTRAPSGNIPATNLIEKAKDAYWTNNDGTISFGTNDNRGAAAYLYNQKTEDNNAYSRVLFTHPKYSNDGFVQGKYLVKVPDTGNAFFKAKVGFLSGSTSNGVKFSVDWQLKDGSRTGTLGSITALNDGKLDVFRADLNDFKGQEIYIFLKADANGDSASDWAVWTEAVVTNNLVSNPSFEEGTIGSKPIGFTDIGAGAYVENTSETKAVEGKYSLKLADTDGGEAYVKSDSIGDLLSGKYNISYSVRSNAKNRISQMYLICSFGDNSYALLQVTAGTSWKTFSKIVDTTGWNTKQNCYVRLDVDSPYGILYIDDVKLIPSPV